MAIVDTLPLVVRQRFYCRNFNMDAEVLAEAERSEFLSNKLCDRLAMNVSHRLDRSVKSVAIVFDPDKLPKPAVHTPWPATPPDFSATPVTPRPAPAPQAPRNNPVIIVAALPPPGPNRAGDALPQLAGPAFMTAQVPGGATFGIDHDGGIGRAE